MKLLFIIGILCVAQQQGSHLMTYLNNTHTFMDELFSTLDKFTEGHTYKSPNRHFTCFDGVTVFIFQSVRLTARTVPAMRQKTRELSAATRSVSEVVTDRRKLTASPANPSSTTVSARDVALPNCMRSVPIREFVMHCEFFLHILFGGSVFCWLCFVCVCVKAT